MEEISWLGLEDYIIREKGDRILKLFRKAERYGVPEGVFPKDEEELRKRISWYMVQAYIRPDSALGAAFTWSAFLFNPALWPFVGAYAAVTMSIHRIVFGGRYLVDAPERVKEIHGKATGRGLLVFRAGPFGERVKRKIWRLMRGEKNTRAFIKMRKKFFKKDLDESEKNKFKELFILSFLGDEISSDYKKRLANKYWNIMVLMKGTQENKQVDGKVLASEMKEFYTLHANALGYESYEDMAKEIPELAKELEKEGVITISSELLNLGVPYMASGGYEYTSITKTLVSESPVAQEMIRIIRGGKPKNIREMPSAFINFFRNISRNLWNATIEKGKIVPPGAKAVWSLVVSETFTRLHLSLIILRATKKYIGLRIRGEV